MSEFKRLYRPLLEQVHWFAPAELGINACSMANWLLDNTSLSRRFQRYCAQLSVDLIEQTRISSAELDIQERELLGDGPCLIRKVVLKGDGIPWLLGRTLIPLSTLTGSEQDIAELGEVPLGLRVFQAQNAKRDAICLAKVGDSLWARRSRLWVNDKPMLVSEVFLADAPLYRE